ncbi:MAG: hypothetical protein COA44_02165 [Arcobacter sp.]|nr:MAG: hypothetical protein COA44_02165 [Arcobacter sp.]
MMAIVKNNYQNYQGDEQLLFEEIQVIESNIKQAKSIQPRHKSDQAIEVLQDVKRKLMCFDTPKWVRDRIICHLPLLLIQIKKE